jgi:hypothetical protein
MNRQEAKLRKMWELLPEDMRFDLTEAIAKLNASTATVVSAKKIAPANRSKEAEAVLSFIHKPSSIITKRCKFCNLNFGTNYVGVAFCSDECRANDLSAIGIVWDASKTAEARWEGEPPNIINPTTYSFLERFAREILNRQTAPNEQKPKPPTEQLSAIQREMKRLGM